VIRRAEPSESLQVAELALLLWPDNSLDELEVDYDQVLKDENSAVFVASNDGQCIAFAQCTLRNDYVEGTRSHPVGYFEGLFVREQYRRNGVASGLLQKCEDWARFKGCTEFASDCELDNSGSTMLHQSIGFEEVNRIICFVKRL
jgi:aminoglycoside 6'-N-acetyltransferase I